MKTTLYVGMMMLALVGCRLTNKDSEGKIATDLIVNPKSASGKNAPHAELSFLHDKIDFDTLVQGARFDTTIHFTNSGKAPLLIESVKGSCGCTVAKDWPREPLAPGESASFKVSFNSEGKQGQQHNSITIVANTYPSTNMVIIHGTVIVPQSIN